MWLSGMDGILLDLRQKHAIQEAVKDEPQEFDDLETGDNFSRHTVSPHSFSLGLENSRGRRLPLKCSDCGKSFSHSSSLKRHSRTHTGVRPFICNICNKGFHYKNNLQDHARTHTGEKPFKCPDCGQSFAQSSTLNRHIGTHGKDNICQICGKAFAKLSLLQRHLASHGEKQELALLSTEGVTLDECVKQKFSVDKIAALKSIQDLTCVKCGTKFNKVADLQQHFWSHLGDGQALYYELAALNSLLNMLELIKQGKTDSGNDSNKSPA